MKSSLAPLGPSTRKTGLPSGPVVIVVGQAALRVDGVKLFEIRALEHHPRLTAEFARLQVRHNLDVLVIVDLEVDRGDASALIRGAERLLQSEDALIVAARLGEIAHPEGDPGESDDWHLGCRCRGSRCGLCTSPRLAAAALGGERLTGDQEDEQRDDYFSASHVRSSF